MVIMNLCEFVGKAVLRLKVFVGIFSWFMVHCEFVTDIMLSKIFLRPSPPRGAQPLHPVNNEASITQFEDLICVGNKIFILKSM